MLKQQSKLLHKVALAVDSVAIVTSFVLSYNVVQSLTGRLSQFLDYSWVLVVVIPVWFFLLTHFGIYNSMRTRPFPKIIADLMKVHAIGGVITTSVVFLVNPTGFSRIFMGSFILCSLVLIVTEKGGIKLLLTYFRRRGFNSRNILIVGTGERAQLFAKLAYRHADWGIVIAGIVGLPDEEQATVIPGYPRLGTLEELVEICKSNMVDEVIFSLPCELFSLVDEYLMDLQDMGVVVRLVIDLYEAPTSRKELDMFNGHIPMLTYHVKAFDAGQLFLKRCLDVVGAMVGLVISALFFPFIALAIKSESRGPLFFGQRRVGENGRIFTCWKFRSMFVDAEEQKKELMDRNEMRGAMFKIKDDPRVTKVGRFIRKTSLDELPQFWNVLVGEMSLVGTRPPTPDEVASYQNWHRKRICIRPGITGLWQVSGRNQIQDFDDVVRLDIQYIEEWSLWLDIKILFKTIWVVMASKGAR
jgi:exopolysaccharide biosynthesis polyprenyl glycosylphosphotransferase